MPTSEALKPPPGLTAKPTRDSSTIPCKFFAKQGTCKNGSTCEYSHDPSIVEKDVRPFRTGQGIGPQKPVEIVKAAPPGD
jgi:hypothetical protein